MDGHRFCRNFRLEKGGSKWGMKRNPVEILQNLLFEPATLCEGVGARDISLGC
jgi:hypothetical protein